MTVFYHWWAGDEQPNYSNLSHPILLSIATLRAVNKTIPIKVLDFSNTHYDSWMSFKEKLNFEIIPQTQFFLHEYSAFKGWNLLSRIFDVRRNCDGLTIYCDSDVFWLKDPLPLECDTSKFCFDGFNSGFFYFDNNSPIVRSLLDEFESLVFKCLKDEEFCNSIKKATNYNDWPYIWDETIMMYMKQNSFTDMFDTLADQEHMVMRHLNRINGQTFKMLHCNGMLVENPLAKRKSETKHSRGLVCLLFKEFYNNIKSILTDEEISMIFTQAEIDFCLSNQISLFDKQKIQDHRMSDGHYLFQVTPKLI